MTSVGRQTYLLWCPTGELVILSLNRDRASYLETGLGPNSLFCFWCLDTNFGVFHLISGLSPDSRHCVLTHPQASRLLSSFTRIVGTYDASYHSCEGRVLLPSFRSLLPALWQGGSPGNSMEQKRAGKDEVRPAIISQHCEKAQLDIEAKFCSMTGCLLPQTSLILPGIIQKPTKRDIPEPNWGACSFAERQWGEEILPNICSGLNPGACEWCSTCISEISCHFFTSEAIWFPGKPGLL